ncbi:MAG: hypothetical protein IT193_10535 [Propionibacteriaceae bacterium]|nr:hypothetical protein [Propionibacteriaceae bacterium]
MPLDGINLIEACKIATTLGIESYRKDGHIYFLDPLNQERVYQNCRKKSATRRVTKFLREARRRRQLRARRSST